MTRYLQITVGVLIVVTLVLAYLLNKTSYELRVERQNIEALQRQVTKIEKDLHNTGVLYDIKKELAIRGY